MRSLLRFSRFLKPHWHWAVLAPLLMAGEVVLDLLQPRLLQQVIDQGIARSNQTLVLHTGGWMILCAIGGLIAGLSCAVFSVLAGQGLGTDLRSTVFRKVQSLSFGNLDDLETGGLITRLTNDVTQVQDVITIMLRVMVRMPFLLTGSLVMGILTSPRLAGVFLLLIPTVITTLVLVVAKTHPMFREVQKRLDTLNTVLQENLAGVRVVKAFARSQHEKQRFARASDDLMNQNIAVTRTSAVTMPIVQLSVNLAIVAILWVGGLHVPTGELRVGEIVAVINYLMQAQMSLMMVSLFLTRVARGEASARRVEEVLESQPEIVSPIQPVTLPSPQGRIAFENVSFSYDSDEPVPVLKDISFTVEPGETVALIGATGSGKSSLIHLIPRFYDPTVGRVTIDGIDVRTISDASLRESVGIALQEAILFSGPIRENIRYGRPDATDAEVIAAAERAQAHDFISRLPDGYDSLIGQRGVNLSGGQKQRIAIARVLLTNPHILILDDTTSAVDVQTEARIQEALEENYQHQTRLIVAQRIRSVRYADKILVLEDGSLVAQGKHEELLKSSVVYREIYDSQINHGGLLHVGE